MCETCGCGDTDLVDVEVQHSILSKNDHQAAHNRAHFLESGVFAVNLMGSPGSGKTAILEATAKAMKQPDVLASVSGDLATDRDAERLNRAGIRSVSITTKNACHLDAQMLHRALHHLPWQKAKIFFIENVGNLVCPAVYDLGQAKNVVVLSVTEGEDKPLKYPVMFRKADLVLLSKTDLLEVLDFDVAAFKDGLARVMPSAKVIALSSKSGEGMDDWLAWLEARG